MAHRRAREIGATTLCWEVPHHVGDDVVEGLVQGTLLHAYRFDRYKPSSEDSRERQVQALVLSAHHDIAEPVRAARSSPPPRTGPATSATPPPTT